jgi:hypothetical protein
MENIVSSFGKLVKIIDNIFINQICKSLENNGLLLIINALGR